MKKHSISISLSLRFMLIISAATIFLSLSIIFLLHRFSRSEKNRELLRFTEESCAKIQAFGIENELLDLPYHISYGIFDKETGTETSTNDPFIPLLPLTEKKSRHYFEKDFYIDQNLNIFYFSKVIEYSGRAYIIQLSMDLERDPNLQFFLHLPKIIIFILIPLLLISFFMCFLITRQTIKPVEKMTDSAKRIFHENSSEYLPVSKKNTELDNLAETFNALFKKLKADFQREKDFTGNVSHELKTPIAIILGEAKLIKRWGKNDKKQLEESIDTIIEEGTFMEEITKNLLQLTKLESGIIKPDKKEFSVKALFQK
ncbi:MAG: HAMP domain-containing histidine kinase, partial [Spirochaetia bacterium]|nr:HAMP domain-containing histidine kinase [Spirochaetia bacterium]